MRVFCVFLVLALSFGGQLSPVASAAQEEGFSVDDGEKTKAPLISQVALGKLWGGLWELPQFIVEEDKEIVSNSDYVTAILLAGGGSIALHSSGADSKIADGFEDKQILSKFTDEMTYFLGGPGFHFAATGLWYLMSESSGDAVNNERAWTMLKALSVTGATTLGMKLIRNNDTPNGKPLAWPSGHTSSSFTVAAVLDELYGPEIGVPAYVGAGFVGYRMMESGDHWASDVLFGAVLGYVVGHHIAGKYEAVKVAGFKVVPFSEATRDGAAMGVRLVKRF